MGPPVQVPPGTELSVADIAEGLRREKMINIALLCGSDYTLGVQRVGPVFAPEIMAEFQGGKNPGPVDFK
ncbi:DNA repair protein complementing XP-G cells-like [Mizuhopecten yessoensis]|uniref:DNA repair protein complementing XP-G cells-like n=1 Tax=Mizuhopecten yessoensis TaxID=6573 RepID=A0A210QAG0_MIZYE|nr:DNA repair protein complementing XP-G cells-like [Mizuhopecten yessoensis]